MSPNNCVFSAQGTSVKRRAKTANTRAQFKQVFDALRALMTPPEPRKRPIGFVTSKEK
jgi:hypothetical protein